MSSSDNAHIAECGTNSFSDVLCARLENCSNSVDDDGDGLVDCADPDCKVWEVTPAASLGMLECTGSVQTSDYCAGDTNPNCPATGTCECYDPTPSTPPETRYCSDGNVGEYAYRHDNTGTCLPQTSPIPECVNEYCSGDDNLPDCPFSFTNDDPSQCLDYVGVYGACSPGQGLLYDSTAVPKTNEKSICCPVNQYAYYDSDFDTYECRDTAPCYDPGDPTLYDCHFDFLTEFSSWIASTTDDPSDTSPGNIWCVAPAPSSGAAAQVCCPEVKFGVFDYYSAEEDNVVIY